jgi:hypothetical protein
MMLNKNRNSSNSAPRLMKDGRESRIVSNIICRGFNLLIVLSTRRIRKILIKVAWVSISALAAGMIPYRIVNPVKITTEKSNIFQESWKYWHFIAMILTKASIANTNMNT